MSSLRGPRGEIFLSGRKSFAFSEQLVCFTFTDIIRHGANQVLPLVLATGKLRVNVCSIFREREEHIHELQLTNIHYLIKSFLF